MRAKGGSHRGDYLINFGYQHLSVKMSFVCPAGGNQFQPVLRGQGFLSKVMRWGRLPVLHKTELCVEGKYCPEDSSGLEGVLAYGAGRIEMRL